MTQKEALDLLQSGANVFLTGAPGSGKTHTIGAFIDWLRLQGRTPGITASTGIAATHLGGMTIHSWSGIGVKETLSPADRRGLAKTRRLVERAQRTDVLIIDEVSMLSSGTLQAVNEACKTLRDNKKPFGGLQIVLVGDFFQLPPVRRRDPAEVARPDLFGSAGGDTTIFAFSSPAWHEADLQVCYLTEQHRHSDRNYLGILSSIRDETVDDDEKQELATRFTQQAPKDVPKLFTHNRDVDKDNARLLDRLPGDAHRFKMEWEGPTPLAKALARGCLSPENLELKVNARVMFTRNDFTAGFVNGTTGTVVEFQDDADGLPIVETDDGQFIEVEPAEWRMEEGDDENALIRQVPLRLAWAITVHKSQGMSLGSAYMNLSRTFEFGQGYVALSRVRTLDGLYLAGINDQALRVHPHIVDVDRSWRRE
ncbi:MAG: hypothetical protein COV99_07285 [Bacteroidetes bacterium CG12_big_fil_rev_8_21_14_0_65_60_17]|nr:MAG: hypothetical protein COV99_07285 [Bacteroidetes bacterium CG12_big_fil_rev_8_21_14_0_65_60_17]